MSRRRDQASPQAQQRSKSRSQSRSPGCAATPASKPAASHGTAEACGTPGRAISGHSFSAHAGAPFRSQGTTIATGYDNPLMATLTRRVCRIWTSSGIPGGRFGHRCPGRVARTGPCCTSLTYERYARRLTASPHLQRMLPWPISRRMPRLSTPRHRARRPRGCRVLD
jgi:hypothetical protein